MNSAPKRNRFDEIGQALSAPTPSSTADDPPRPDPTVSVVAPVFNEEETLPELVRRVVSVISKLPGEAEFIIVDDGSCDHTPALLHQAANEHPAVKYVTLARNFGHQAAMYAGMSRARGDVVILMDGDLQDPPEVIPDMVNLWKRGFDVVFAVRKKRKEGLLKRLAYRIYYRILESVAYIPIPRDSGDFSLIDRRVCDIICQLPERNKFLRGLRAWVGLRQTAYEYERDSRHAGATKYTLPKLFSLALDGLMAYSFVPLRLAYVVGLVISMFSFVLAAFYVVQRLLGWSAIPQGFTTLAVLILFLGGVQLVCIGVLGEYLGRVFEEMKGRPIFVERKAVNFEGSRPREESHSSGPTMTESTG